MIYFKAKNNYKIIKSLFINAVNKDNTGVWKVKMTKNNMYLNKYVFMVRKKYWKEVINN